MKLAVVFIAAGALVGPAAASAAASDGSAANAHAASSLPPCIPKFTTLKGHEAIEYCGPATATLVLGGKTYSFKDGYCSKDQKAGVELQVTLGTIVDGQTSKGNAGAPWFELQVVKSSGITIETVDADVAGKVLALLDTATIKGSISSSGTFSSAKSVLAGSSHFTGSWSCHGPIYTI
ncbi:MAG TPA: hypothetical protein VHM72_00500 [Solirubrobacteraceae bacterium]|jgi:hypothetical protein|nr:hypothetical protein [Solirubrobacteraceae bacterium]